MIATSESKPESHITTLLAVIPEPTAVRATEPKKPRGGRKHGDAPLTGKLEAISSDPPPSDVSRPKPPPSDPLAFRTESRKAFRELQAGIEQGLVEKPRHPNGSYFCSVPGCNHWAGYAAHVDIQEMASWVLIDGKKYPLDRRHARGGKLAMSDRQENLDRLRQANKQGDQVAAADARQQLDKIGFAPLVVSTLEQAKLKAAEHEARMRTRKAVRE